MWKFVEIQSKFWYGRSKYYRNSIKKLIGKSKNNHLWNYFQENYSDSEKTWSKLNEFLHRRQLFENIFLGEDGKIASNHKTITNKFNNYFTHVAVKLPENIGKTNKFQDTLKIQTDTTCS